MTTSDADIPPIRYPKAAQLGFVVLRRMVAQDVHSHEDALGLVKEMIAEADGPEQALKVLMNAVSGVLRMLQRNAGLDVDHLLQHMIYSLAAYEEESDN